MKIIKAIADFLNGKKFSPKTQKIFSKVVLILVSLNISQVLLARCVDEKINKKRILTKEIELQQTIYADQTKEIYNKKLASKLKEKVNILGLKPMRVQPII